MSRYNFNDATPFEATSVGELLKDELNAREMTQSDLAKLTGIQRSILNDVIKGRRALTPEMAVIFEKVLDIEAAFFLNLQTQYEIDQARISKRVVEQMRLVDIWNILKEHISTQFFKKVGLIKGNLAADIPKIFDVFEVSSIDELIHLKANESILSYYKKSEKSKTNPIDIFSWKFYCYYLARNAAPLDCQFNKDTDPRELTDKLNSIFKENVNTVDHVTRLLNDYGIHFFIVEKTGQAPVDGISFWRGAHPTIVVTKRISTIDNFAFTIFHEIGHLYKHLARGSESLINIEGGNDNVLEEEADNFATNAILPYDEWRGFLCRVRSVSPYSIVPYITEEAMKFNINPQLLFGRYKHDLGFYKIPKQFNSTIG